MNAKEEKKEKEKGEEEVKKEVKKLLIRQDTVKEWLDEMKRGYSGRYGYIFTTRFDCYTYPAVLDMIRTLRENGRDVGQETILRFLNETGARPLVIQMIMGSIREGLTLLDAADPDEKESAAKIVVAVGADTVADAEGDAAADSFRSSQRGAGRRRVAPVLPPGGAPSLPEADDSCSSGGQLILRTYG